MGEKSLVNPRWESSLLSPSKKFEIEIDSSINSDGKYKKIVFNS